MSKDKRDEYQDQKINTGGGSYVRESVITARDNIGRDQINIENQNVRVINPTVQWPVHVNVPSLQLLVIGRESIFCHFV